METGQELYRDVGVTGEQLVKRQHTGVTPDVERIAHRSANITFTQTRREVHDPLSQQRTRILYIIKTKTGFSFSLL